MGAYSGVARNPHTGKNVAWTLAPGLALLGRQLDRLGITWYSIGNADHLRKQGGHTPWKPGAPFGVVTAIDVMKGPYSTVQTTILRLMKKADYDTTWIDFINVNYNQYDWNAVRQGPSGDGHLHLEVLGNRTHFTSTLFSAMFGGPVDKPTPAPISTPATNVTNNWEECMLKTVKLRSRDDVWLVLGGGSGLQHLTKDQLKAIQDYNARQLPSNPNAATRAKYLEPFVVEDEEALAAFGRTIIKQTTQVEGLN